MGAELVLAGVEKAFNGIKVLAGVDLTVRNGELLVLVGPSGCGKTTTLRLIAGLEEPTRGTICIGGRTANGLSPRRRNVGMIFQRPALYPHRTIGDNLLFPSRLRPTALQKLFGGHRQQTASVHRQQTVEMARILGLEGLLDRYPTELSGGQQQRVALGRALLRQPAVLLLDEPLGHLDGPLRLELRRQLHLLHQRFPATMVHVTHDAAEALALGDRVAVLDGGVIQQVDRPDIIVLRPANRRVASIVCQRHGPMNFIDGRLIEHDGRLVFRGLISDQPVPHAVAIPWRPFRDRQVTIGVGPENVKISEMNSATGVIPVRLVLIEFNEGTLTACCSAQGLNLTGIVAAGRPVPGQAVFAGIEWERTMLFDRENGQMLAAPAG